MDEVNVDLNWFYRKVHGKSYYDVGRQRSFKHNNQMIRKVNSKKHILQKQHFEQMKKEMLKKLAIEKRLEEIDKKYAENQIVEDFDNKNFKIDSFGQKIKIKKDNSAKICRNFDW